MVDETMAVRVEMEDVRSDLAHSEILASVAERTWDVRSGDSPVAPSQLEPFIRAGYSFVAPRDEMISALRAGTRREQLTEAHASRVLRVQETGDIVIGTDRVVIRAQEDATDAHVENALANNGLEPVRSLRFGSRRYYQAVTSKERDVFDAADAVGQDPVVQAAELRAH